MGYIRDDIKIHFLSTYPEQQEMLKPFLSGFIITHADKYEINNTTLYAYMLKPEKFIQEAFGIEREILLAYTPYDIIQPRALQAFDLLFNKFPIKNRVDTLNCFLISRDPEIIKYGGMNSLVEDHLRSIVPFIYQDLIEHSNDSWYVRNVLKKNFYDIDLFGYTLPLKNDSSFFGRHQIIGRYIDSIKRCENRGIFGLRKTGKTSLIFRIDRVVREQKLGFIFYYDCKSPSYRKLHWNDFLGEICNNISKSLNVKIRPEYDEKNIIKSFSYLMKTASDQQKKIIIVFDEIEYISFNSTLDKHWENEYLDFWQTMWSVQSLYRNLVFIIAGVNASVTEIDTVKGVQNPLFGIVQQEYLQGLTNEEAHDMIRVLGRRMGINFNYHAIDLLYNQFNGHPMLLRLACSYINRQYSDLQRPIEIKEETINNLQEEIDLELSYYFKHVVSEIQQFYHDEYEMFELLASGQTTDFIELSTLSEYTKHLYHYGLIAEDESKIPYVKMPVAGRYVALELAKSENRRSLYRLVEPEKREVWVTQRIKSIIRDVRQLESAIQMTKKSKLFGENSFPEAEKFSNIHPVKSQGGFSNFFNTCNRCFVESIENYGKSIGDDKYLYTTIKTEYPSLFGVLERIKIYRHSEDHLKLNDSVAKKYKEYWDTDTQGIEDTNDQLFCVQQKILESFMTALQIEISNIT